VNHSNLKSEPVVFEKMVKNEDTPGPNTQTLYGRNYKKEFALLPTVDHVGDGTGPLDLKICSWRTNDAKNDLPLSEFISVCQAVLKHHGYVINKTG